MRTPIVPNANSLRIKETRDLQMTDATLSLAAAPTYEGTNRLILGIVLAVVTFWLFAQTTLNIAPAMRDDLRISESVNNIAVSITALFSGIFIVVAGSLADRLGRVRLTNAGLALSILGSLLIALSPSGTVRVSHGGTHHPRSFGRLHHARHARADEGLLRGQGAAARARASGPSVPGADRVSARCSADWSRPPSDGAGSSGCPLLSLSLAFC